MGNTEACKSPCIQDCEIIVRQGEEIILTKEDKLEPILFQEPDNYLDVNSIIENQNIDIHLESTPFKGSRVQSDGFEIDKSSALKVSKINLDQMVVVNKPNSANRVSDELIEVPYSVIRLTLTKQMEHSINELGQELFFKFEKPQNKNNHWKLHRKGYYNIQLGENLYGVLTSTSYYEGSLMATETQILPDKQGILLSEKGIYRGNFESGKANGIGSFREIETKTIFKGQWKNGVFVQGTVENSVFRFQGSFKDLFASGKGKISFKQNSYTYLGQFEDGLYHDSNGFLECNKYIYQGGFEGGKKKGDGCLVEKELAQKNRKQKYRPAEQYEGIWNHDSFQGAKESSHFKK